MNFHQAFAHALMGYGIRRTAWVKEATLRYELAEAVLRWNNGEGYIAELCGPDKTKDLQPHDLQAKDWQAI